MKEILLLAQEIGLPSHDIQDITEYIDHNEWGLAFEVLCNSVHQYGFKVSATQYQKICDLGRKMEMDINLINMCRKNII